MQLVRCRRIFFVILTKSGVKSRGVDAASVDRAGEAFIKDVTNIFRHAHIPAIFHITIENEASATSGKFAIVALEKLAGNSNI